MSLSSTKSAKIQELTNDYKLVFKSFYSASQGDVDANLDKLCRGLATAAFNRFYDWLKDAKKPVVTVTTSASGTWTSQPEPNSGSGLSVEL